jgi:hypothetical protein
MPSVVRPSIKLDVEKVMINEKKLAAIKEENEEQVASARNKERQATKPTK